MVGAEAVEVLFPCDKNDENRDATGLCMAVVDDDDEPDPISVSGLTIDETTLDIMPDKV
jgi:hypothetical protein